MNKTNINYYVRSKDIFDPLNCKYKIHILGCGALGSWIALNLAKMGISDITAYDYDIVKDVNIGGQIYRTKDIDKLKTKALKEIIKEFSDIEIKTIDGKVTKNTELNTELNTIYILSFDTFEQRKILYELVKDFKCYVLDVRVGGEEYNIRLIDTFNDKHMKDWKKSLNLTPTQLPCGARSISYTNLSVAAEVCNIIKKLSNNEKHPKRIIRHMGQYLILNNQEKK